MKKLLIISGTIFATLMGIIALGILFMHFAVQRVVMDGPSMEPTLHKKQVLTIKPYRSNKLPMPGEVIEFKSSNKLVKQYATSDKLIKRIIALPGERVVIVGGDVRVINPRHLEGLNPDAGYPAAKVITSGTVDITLGEDQYFVLGDNRPESLDSRAIGPVLLQDIIGKVQL